MCKTDKPSLEARVTDAAAAALADAHCVAPIDVLLRLGWLQGSVMQRWYRGELGSLEPALNVSPERLAQGLALLRAWVGDAGLIPSPAPYVARTPRRQALRFSASGDPAREAAYRTHWISPDLPAAARRRVIEKASKPPELVVIDPRNQALTCHRCGRGVGFMMMETPGPACLDCLGLGDLVFLPSGDAKLTRRAKAKCARAAVVVRWSRTRKRYERQGLMVEPSALDAARAEIAAEG